VLPRIARCTRALACALLLVCVTVVSVGGPPAGSSWASTASSAATETAAQAADGSPVGSFDGPSIRLTTLRRAAYDYTLYGWAADPDAPGQPTTVGVFVNSGIGNNVTTGEPRPDVEAAFPWAGPNSGFSFDVAGDGEDAAPKTVCLYIVNSGAGHDTGLGCVTLPTPATDGHEPIGSLDEVTVAPGLVHIRGWAGDRDEPGTDVALRVFEDFGPAFALTANTPRPDVPVVFPQLDSTTSFRAPFPRPQATRKATRRGSTAPIRSGRSSRPCTSSDGPSIPTRTDHGPFECSPPSAASPSIRPRR
jgi:hypothetical protein